MPRLTLIAAFLFLALLSIAVPTATAQPGFAAQPEELWEEFPLDSDKSQTPKPEGEQSPPGEAQGNQESTPPSAPTETEPPLAQSEESGNDGSSMGWLGLGALAALAVLLTAGLLMSVTRRRGRKPEHPEHAEAKPAAASEAAVETERAVPAAAAAAAPAESPAPTREDKPAPAEAKAKAKPKTKAEGKPAPAAAEDSAARAREEKAAAEAQEERAAAARERQETAAKVRAERTAKARAERLARAKEREEKAAKARAERAAAAKEREERVAKQREEQAAREREEQARKEREEKAAKEREEMAAKEREERAAQEREEQAAAAKAREEQEAAAKAEEEKRAAEARDAETPAKLHEETPESVPAAKRPAKAREENPTEVQKKRVPAQEPTTVPAEAEQPAPAQDEPEPVNTPVAPPVLADRRAPLSSSGAAGAPKLEVPPPAPRQQPPQQPQRMLELPDDVIPFPTRPGRISQRATPTGPLRALGYVSAADADAQGSDLEDQTEQIRAACTRNGFESVEVVRDFESLSSSDLERPGLIYAVERLEAGEANCLVVASLERLTRSASHLGTLIDRLGESNIRLVVLDIELDTGNPDGRLAAEALANVGTLERKSLDSRTRKGLEAAREARRSSGRPAVADRPALKERIAEMRARGMTLQAIADTLNAEDVPTLRGGAEWRPSSVQAAVGYKRPKRGARKTGNGTPS